MRPNQLLGTFSVIITDVINYVSLIRYPRTNEDARFRNSGRNRYSSCSENKSDLMISGVLQQKLHERYTIIYLYGH